MLPSVIQPTSAFPAVSTRARIYVRFFLQGLHGSSARSKGKISWITEVRLSVRRTNAVTGTKGDLLLYRYFHCSSDRRAVETSFYWSRVRGTLCVRKGMVTVAFRRKACILSLVLFVFFILLRIYYNGNDNMYFFVVCLCMCVRGLSQGLAECPIPMPSKLAPPPGKRSPPSPVPPSKKSPKKIEPREVCAVDSVPTSWLWLGSRAPS